MQADALREKFLDFFKSKKHKIVESDTLVPAGDPTVLFTPAGMNQFKKEFLGYDSGFKRAASAQRCLRTDDLDKVGKTSGHHTFFEMLGNFSFGDYFKKEAIQWAWEFLTEELKIKKERLWISVYKDDAEAYKIWLELIKVPARRIIKLGDKENFWPSEAKQKGPNGPCGPCSEIFFDQGANIGCKEQVCDPSCSCGRFIEVWNLVFTQFNRKEAGILEPLPKKNIDTGMGMERLAAVMQGALSNFETDLFKPLLKEIEAKAGLSQRKEVLYAVADHIRAISFAIYDGVLPSNEARGYVVRKLIRKSILQLRLLRIMQPFLYKLVPVLAQIMKAPYPELLARKENISEIILAEEKSFISILKSSDKYLLETFTEPHNIGDPERVASLMFRLTDTYGLPLEIITNWLDKHGGTPEGTLDLYNKKLLEQKNRSKLQSTMKGDVFNIKESDYAVKETKFLGYRDYSVKAKIIKILKDNQDTTKITKGDAACIILEKTSFYPEAGGQVADAGELVKGKNIFSVVDTKKDGKAILHIGQVKSGSFKTGDFVEANINVARRLSIARNHTATHLLQAALRKVLGEHVKQQGSLVAEDRLRFDFTHFKALDKEQLDRVEEIVNNLILNNYKLKTKLANLAEAKKSGALAFFQEKYEGRVRVVSVEGVSRELCAGTHLENTGQIGLFRIIQEGSVASGIRRIEAATGVFAYKTVKKEESIISDTESLLGVTKERIADALKERLLRIKELEKQLSAQKTDTLKSSIDSDIEAKQVIAGINLITHVDVDANSVRKSVDLIKERLKSNAFIVSSTGTNLGNRVFLAIGITQDLVDKGLDASKLIGEAASIIGGSGGGRRDFAQAGGNNPQGLANALKKIEDIISQFKI